MQLSNLLKSNTEKIILSGSIPFYIGEPGCGKTSVAKEIATDLNCAGYFVLACNQLADRADLTGARLVPVKQPDGTETYAQRYFPHLTIMNAIMCARENPAQLVLLVLDEINRTATDLTSALLSLATTREIGSEKLPDNLRIMATGNNKGNVTTLDSASISRFVPIPVEPDAQTFLALKEWNPYIVKTLSEHPSLIFAKKMADRVEDDDDDDSVETTSDIDDLLADDEVNQFTCPRTLEYLSNFLNELTRDDLCEMMNTSNGSESALTTMIEGFIGHTEFAMYLFSNIIEDITSATTATPDLKVTKPNNFDDIVALPTKTDMQVAIQGLSDDERSSLLVYAIADRTHDWSSMAQILCQNTAMLSADASKTIMQLARRDQINNAVLESITSVTTPTAQFITMCSNM